MAVSQQVFLRDAMRRLNLTRDVFAARIGVKRRALDTWLLPEGSQEFRGMPEVVQRFVTEIVENETLLEKYAQNSQRGPLRDRIAIHGKHQLISVDQFTRESVEELVRIADMMQPIARRQKVSRVLEGAVLGNLFFEASTRTRVSFGAAFCRLGGSVCDTTGFTFSSMAKGDERLCRCDGHPSPRAGIGSRICCRNQYSCGQWWRWGGRTPQPSLARSLHDFDRVFSIREIA